MFSKRIPGTNNHLSPALISALAYPAYTFKTPLYVFSGKPGRFILVNPGIGLNNFYLINTSIVIWVYT